MSTLCPTAANPPAGLMVTQVTDTSVMVSWTPPADTTGVTGYRIFYTENGGSEQFRDVSGASTDMDTIPDLTTGSTYSITIVATSNVFLSEVVGPVMVELGTRCPFNTHNKFHNAIAEHIIIASISAGLSSSGFVMLN